MPIPTPLIGPDIASDFFMGRPMPGSPNLARLKSIALQYEHVYLPARSESEVRAAIDAKQLGAEDVIPASNSDYDFDTQCQGYAGLFEVTLEQVKGFMKPLPPHANPLVSRPLYTGLNYGAQSAIPGFPEIDLWSSAIQSAAAYRLGDTLDYAQTTRVMRDRMFAVWLWMNDSIPTVTGNALLFEVIKQMTALNMAVNASLLNDEAPLMQGIRAWVSDYLAASKTMAEGVDIVPVRKAIPNCEALSWPEIFRLRDSNGFRDYIAMAPELQTATSDADVNRLLAEINNRLFELVAETNPSPASVLCEGIGEEIAGWFIPGVGIASTAKETYDAWKRRKNYAAIFWLQDARRDAAKV